VQFDLQGVALLQGVGPGEVEGGAQLVGGVHVEHGRVEHALADLGVGGRPTHFGQPDRHRIRSI